MKIEATEIKDVFIITPESNEDGRGFFMESYRADVFERAGILDVFVQDNHSKSTKKNTIRGLNFQWKPPMAKVMRVTHGSAFLVAVDLRKDSPTLGKWVGIEASEENKKQLYASGSFARGFQTLTDDVEVQYKCSTFYNSGGEGEIAWDDSDIKVEWPLKGEPFLSERSRTAPSFADWLTRPESNLFI